MDAFCEEVEAEAAKLHIQVFESRLGIDPRTDLEVYSCRLKHNDIWYIGSAFMVEQGKRRTAADIANLLKRYIGNNI